MGAGLDGMGSEKISGNVIFCIWSPKPLNPKFQANIYKKI